MGCDPDQRKGREMGQGNESCFKERSRAASTTANLSEWVYEITRNQFQSFFDLQMKIQTKREH